MAFMNVVINPFLRLNGGIDNLFKKRCPKFPAITWILYQKSYMDDIIATFRFTGYV